MTHSTHAGTLRGYGYKGNYAVSKRFITALLVTLSIFVFDVRQAKATHIMGVDLTYECVSPGQYRLHLQVYRDCHGILPGNTMTVNFSSVQCNDSGSVTLHQVGGALDIT
ncbi:MAG: hypothetical protein ACHQRM_18070, partial [Bacteroidia bacterium]